MTAPTDEGTTVTDRAPAPEPQDVASATPDQRTRDELLAEIVFWRTAALTRWAERATEEGGRSTKELEQEVTELKRLLAATQQTFSWRVTAPLRAVQAARVRTGRR